ncbi:hypothetical protein FRC06_000672 [Ceratobasidium sp. 370]|nr:hypothetical protein FRC06_000672 [Ceratobasidium sp. 370]
MSSGCRAPKFPASKPKSVNASMLDSSREETKATRPKSALVEPGAGTPLSFNTDQVSHAPLRKLSPKTKSRFSRIEATGGLLVRMVTMGYVRKRIHSLTTFSGIAETPEPETASLKRSILESCAHIEAAKIREAEANPQRDELKKLIKHVATLSPEEPDEWLFERLRKELDKVIKHKLTVSPELKRRRRQGVECARKERIAKGMLFQANTRASNVIAS